MSFYAVGAEAVTAVHFTYVAFVVVGELAILLGAAFRCRWARNPWFRGLHLLAIAYVAAEAIFHVSCPLTVWEGQLRVLAGQPENTQTFVQRLVHFFFMDAGERWPEWVYDYLHIGFGVLVLLTFVLIPPRWRKKRPAIQPAAPSGNLAAAR